MERAFLPRLWNKFCGVMNIHSCIALFFQCVYLTIIILILIIMRRSVEMFHHMFNIGEKLRLFKFENGTIFFASSFFYQQEINQFFSFIHIANSSILPSKSSLELFFPRRDRSSRKVFGSFVDFIKRTRIWIQLSTRH